MSPKIRLLLKLFHIIAVGTAEHSPVNVPEIITRLISTEFGELG
jgi:hypothetical protein